MAWIDGPMASTREDGTTAVRQYTGIWKLFSPTGKQIGPGFPDVAAAKQFADEPESCGQLEICP